MNQVFEKKIYIRISTTASEHKRYLISLKIKETLHKATVRNTFSPIRLAKIETLWPATWQRDGGNRHHDILLMRTKLMQLVWKAAGNTY